MKKFLTQLLFFVPMVLLIAGVNYFVDPANLFSEGKYEEGIAGYLTRGYHVTNVVNYDERLLQKFFINELSQCPSEIVLGSSRVMLINESYAESGKLINNGVSGATLEDEMAIYDLYEKKGCRIQKVIIGVDPWILNDNHDQTRWTTLADECNEFTKKILHSSPLKPRGNSQFARYEELFSFSYFKTSLDYLIKGIDKKYQPTKLIQNKMFTRLIDGSIYYDEAFRMATPDQVKKRADEVIAINPIYSLRQFTQLSENYKLLFSKFIEYLQGKNVEVEFFLAPYNPIVYNYFRQNNAYRMVFNTEKYFRGFAERHGVKVIGSYDPARYNLDSSFFYDGYHCTEKAIKLILGSKN
jgi:hypothetical protein